MAAITASEVQTGAHGDDHPSDLIYWKVFFALVALTALEVSTYWWPEDWHRVTAVLLIVMMVIKFATVALYFMHLKNDAPLLRRVFFAGLALAVGVYVAALGAMVYFSNSGTSVVQRSPAGASDAAPRNRSAADHQADRSQHG